MSNGPKIETCDNVTINVIDTNLLRQYMASTDGAALIFKAIRDHKNKQGGDCEL